MAQSMSEFRILDWHKVKSLGIPQTIPWSLVEPFRERSLKWHNQTLERINERGGFSIQELYVHFHDGKAEDFYQANQKQSLPKIVAWFKEWLMTSKIANEVLAMGLTTETLAEAIEEIHADRADKINNDGLEAQIEFLHSDYCDGNTSVMRALLEKLCKENQAD